LGGPAVPLRSCVALRVKVPAVIGLAPGRPGEAAPVIAASPAYARRNRSVRQLQPAPDEPAAVPLAVQPGQSDPRPGETRSVWPGPGQAATAPRIHRRR